MMKSAGSYIISCIVATLGIFEGYSQELPEIILPSPQTQELNKYIDFPVNYSSGVPEISIPLYIVKTKGVDIPITLNYHASGIKYGQDDGNVGVGWSLSCDYRVSRTIYGQPDAGDIEMNPSSYQAQMQYYDNNLSFPAINPPFTVDSRYLLYPFMDRDKYLKRFLPMPYQTDETYPAQDQPLLDGEYDHFNYSIPGVGGKFIITNRTNKIVKEINPSRSRFDYLEGTASNNLTSGIIGFTIKDDNQNIFSFGEQVDKLGSKVLETNESFDMKNVTAWALTDIDTKYGEKVKFHYDSKNVSSKYKKQVSIDIKDPLGDLQSSWLHSVDNEAKKSDYSIFSLSSIKTSYEHIKFITQNVVDAPNKVSRIDIVDSLTNNIIRRIDFYYHTAYFNYHSFTFLDSLKIIGKDLDKVEQRYSFDYYDENDYSYGYIGANNLIPDQFGYNKVSYDHDALLHNEFENDHLRPHGYPATTNRLSGKFSESYLNYLANRKEYSSPEVFSLRSIQYPTGGTTFYQYEPNMSSDQTPNYLGGIRIKSIQQLGAAYDINGDATLTQRRDFVYGGGYRLSMLTFNEFRKEYPIFEIPPGDAYAVARRGLTYSTNYLGDTREIDNVVYYPKVTEFLFSSQGNNGKTVYQYSNELTSLTYSPFNIQLENSNGYFQYYVGGPTYASNYSLWKHPVLVSKHFYNNADKLIKKESYSYSVFNNQSFTGLKVRPYVKVVDNFSEYFPLYYAYVSSIFNHGLYTFEIGNTLPIQKMETTYSETDSLTTVTNYEYNSLNQVNKETVIDSKNSLIERRFVYPADISYENTAMQMIAANDVSRVLEESVKKNNIVIKQVQDQYYQLTNGIFVRSKTIRFNPSSQLLEDAIFFKKYDIKGNITSISKADNLTINYIWSYQNRFPVAEVKGVSYETIESVLGSTAIENFGLSTNPSQADITNFLLPLKTAIQNGTLPLVEIISFSYDPHVGIKTQTDSRGVTTYYDYDSFNRLTSIKDEQGRLLKKTEYHYNNHN